MCVLHAWMAGWWGKIAILALRKAINTAFFLYVCVHVCIWKTNTQSQNRSNDLWALIIPLTFGCFIVMNYSHCWNCTVRNYGPSTIQANGSYTLSPSLFFWGGFVLQRGATNFLWFYVMKTNSIAEASLLYPPLLYSQWQCTFQALPPLPHALPNSPSHTATQPCFSLRASPVISVSRGDLR